MTTQIKTLSILGLAALAAGLLNAVQPASAAGLTHPAAFTRTAAIADHNDWNSRSRDNDRRDAILRRQEEFRREQAIRREEEIRREQQIRREEARRHDDRHHDDRRDFWGDRDNR